MKKKIASLCQALEQEHGIKIIFCIESGSRVWRMQSKDSDYDPRFVFYYFPLKRYFHIDRLSEVLQLKEDLIDMVGFDLRKYARLLANSNPSALEWTQSDIVYYGKKLSGFMRFAHKHFNPTALYHHYFNLAKNNYYKYIGRNKDVTPKRYLYIFRGIINAKYAQACKLPPMNFQRAIESADIPAWLKQSIFRLIEHKRAGEEKEKIDRIDRLDFYIENFLARESPPKPSKPPAEAIRVLNRTIDRILQNA